MKVAFDLVRATPALRSEVMRLAAVAGLRPYRAVLTVGVKSVLGPREVSFPVVEVDGDASAAHAAAKAAVPRDRVAPAQWRVEDRPASLSEPVVDIHAGPVGVATWLVVEGDIMPLAGGTPTGPGTPGTPVAEFQKAATA